MIKNKLIFSVTVLSFFLINILTALDISRGSDLQLLQCAAHEIQQTLKEKEVSFALKSNVLYAIRDKVLSSSVKGKRYVEEYYYISKIEKDFSKLSLKSMTEIVELMPLIYVAYDDYKNPEYNGKIINTELKKSLINVLGSFKELSQDVMYNSIIKNLIKDVESVENKTKAEINEFMNKE